MSKQLGIIFCVEPGLLESQATLLVRSIERFMPHHGLTLFACSPRQNRTPSQFLDADFAVEMVSVDAVLNTEFEDYPIANKLLCSRYVEAQYPEFKNLLFVDTDTLFFKAISADLLAAETALYLRPVDNKGPGTEGTHDANDPFWQAVFDLCGVPLPAAMIETTVRPHLIRPYFNAGLVWANGLPGFFQQWHDDFLTVVASDLRPFGYRSRDGNDFRCLDQVALAVTAARYQADLSVLPATHNYPLPFRPMMQQRPNHPAWSELVHVHYHRWFQHPGFLFHITDEAERQTALYRWLAEQLPLQPEINDPFKC